jgi:uncharacterized membrane protein YccC
VQIAFAFYVCVIQGFTPTWHFDTIRDRLVGILLGNAVITLVFHYVWPLPASGAMWTSLASALRAMSGLASITSRRDDPDVARSEELRLQASRDFGVAQQLADQAAFEPSEPSPEGHGARERLQRAAAEAQSIFLTQITLARSPRDLATPIPDVLRGALVRFDTVVAGSLDAIADGVERDVPGPLPDLREPLAALTERARHGIASGEVARHVQGRLALYSDLVSRIERLGTELAR